MHFFAKLISYSNESRLKTIGGQILVHRKYNDDDVMNVFHLAAIKLGKTVCSLTQIENDKEY